VSQPVPDRARQLAAELELRFAHDAKLAHELNDAHERLQRANDRLWSGLHSDVIAAVYDEHPATVEIAVAENRSQVLGAPDPLRALEETHWAIHQAHCDYQQVAEDRRHLAAATGETIRAFVDELVAAGWSEHEARNACVHDLASHRRASDRAGTT
jgi:hypothetical protein